MELLAFADQIGYLLKGYTKDRIRVKMRDSMYLPMITLYNLTYE